MNECIEIIPGRMDQGEGLVAEGYRLPLIGNDYRPISIPAASRFTHALFRAAGNEYAQRRFRLSMDRVNEAGLQWRYYAPFYQVRPLNIEIEGDPRDAIQRIDQPVRLIVAGSRSFEHYELMKERLDFLCHSFQNQEILVVSAGTTGASLLAEQWALELHYPKTIIEANWKDLEAPRAVVRSNKGNAYNARAGKDRNCYMAMIGTHLAAFPAEAPISSEILDMINQARSLGLGVRVMSPPVNT